MCAVSVVTTSLLWAATPFELCFDGQCLKVGSCFPSFYYSLNKCRYYYDVTVVAAKFMIKLSEFGL